MKKMKRNSFLKADVILLRGEGGNFEFYVIMGEYDM